MSLRYRSQDGTETIVSGLTPGGDIEAGAVMTRTGTITMDCGAGTGNTANVVFDSPMPDSNYLVDLTATAGGAFGVTTVISNKTVNGFDLTITRPFSSAVTITFAYIATKTYTVQHAAQNAEDIANILSVIPSNATSANQLATQSDLENVEIDVDDALDSSSENPVQNKVVKAAIDAKQNKTLDTPIVISGTTETTVEGALGGLNKEKQDNLDLTSETETGNPLLFTTDSEQVAKNTVITFKPFQAGSGDPSPSNPRPIYGYDSLDVLVPRKNWFDGDYVNAFFNATSTPNVILLSSRSTARVAILSIAGGQTYHIHKASGDRFAVVVTAEKPVIGNKYVRLYVGQDTDTDATVTVPDGMRYMLIYVDSANSVEPQMQVELGETATTYEAYNPITDISIKLNETLYGGTLDVESGKLVVDKAIITIGNLSWSYDSSASRFQSGKIANMKYMGTRRMPLVCDSYKTIDDGRAFADVPDYSIYNGGPAGDPLLHIHDSRYTTVSALTTAMGTSKVVFYLAAPITIQLSPAQVKLLQGANVVTTNGTSMSLTYRKGEVAKLSDLSGFADSIIAHVVKVSNRNLLINPWFTVNQRGASQYDTNIYNVDRWYATGNLAAVANAVVVNNGVTLNTGTNTIFLFRQIIENIADLVGETLTLSAKIDGAIYSTTFTLSSSTNISDEVLSNVELTCKYSSQYVGIRLTAANSTHAIRAVKLELGSRSTLHLDIAPDYTTELLKCQRYFVRINNPISGANIAVGFTSSTTNAYIPLRLPVPMRIVPSGSFVGAYALSTGASAGQSVSAIAVHSNSSNQELVLKVTSSGLTSNVPVLLYSNANASYIDLNAEL